MATSLAPSKLNLFEEGFSDFLDNSKYADVQVEHTAQKYACHRLVLSYKSQYFNKELQDENKTSINVSFFADEDNVLPKVLKFLYCGKADITADNVVSIKLAANQFQIDSLTTAVEKYLDANFSADNVFTILFKSIARSDDLLTKKAIAFIAKNFEATQAALKQNVDKIPQQVFFDILGHENMKDPIPTDNTEKKNKAVLELVNDYMNKHNVMSNSTVLVPLIDSLLASNTMNSDYATMFLAHCDKLGLQKQASGCAQVLAANFHSLTDKKFIFELTVSSFCSLLRTDDLFVKSEDAVFDIAQEYVKKNEATLTLAQKKDIMSCVRYAFVNMDRLKALKDEVPEYIDLDWIINALWARVARLEPSSNLSKEDEKELEGNVNLKTRKNKVFVYTSDFDKNGIMYWLGTNCGTDKYINPHQRGNVTVTHSCNCEVGKTQDLISYDAVTCNLVSGTNTNVTIKLHNYCVLPTKYTLRHTMSRDSECLRNWRFQGSKDGSTFVDLMVHQNDAALNLKGATKTWTLDPAKVTDYYQYFRILQDGMNSSNNGYFSMAGFELYGLVIKSLKQ